jgi:uroporphyrin-III C-methyltransferase/precorrin-2 dehydrogenase/sirohydrochlorin ferrochelatase
MIQSLPLYHRITGQPVIVLGEGEAAEAKRRLVERAGGVVVGEDAIGVHLAFIAVANGELAEDAAGRLRARGILVNVVDCPELCDFTVPSLLERGPVLVAIGTGGVSAGLAKALRLRLETMLPPSLGKLAEALGALRQRLRARFPDAGERRRALDAALATGGVLDPLEPGSAERAEGWLDDVARQPVKPAEIRLRSDDPDDLTLREARLLGSADLLAHEAGVPDAILDRARADAMRQVIARGEGPPAYPGMVVVLRLSAP